MFDAISELILHNIQSHENSHFKFKRTGVHRISGNNSEGKSVAFKATDALFFGIGLHKEGRNALIRTGEQYGIISASSFNGINLSLFLHLESKHSFYKLTIMNSEGHEESVTKFLIDDYRELLKIANFHFMQDEGYSLNRYRTKSTLPFTHFSGTMNYKVLDSASENPKFTRMLETIEENYREVKLDRDLNERKVLAMKEQLTALDDSNLTEVERLLSKLTALQKTYDVVESLYYPIKEILDTEKQLSEIEVIDVSHYEELRPSLLTLDQMSIVLGNLIDTESKIIEHDSMPKNQLIDLTSLFRQLEKCEQILVSVDERITALTELEMQEETVVVDLSTLLLNLQTLESVKALTDDLVDIEQQLQEEIKVVDLSDLLENLKTVESLREPLVPLIDKEIKLAEDKIEVVDLSDLLQSLKSMESTSTNIAKYIESCTQLDEVVEVDIIDISSLLSNLSVIESTKSNIDDLSNSKIKIKETDEQLAKLYTECEQLARQIGICSSCGSLLNKHREVS